MAVGDVGVLRIIGRFQAQNIVNTLHYEMTAQASAEAVVWEVMAGVFNSTMTVAWQARHSDAYELVGLKMFTVKGDGKPPGFIPIGDPGDVVGDPQEAFVCRTVTWYTDHLNPRVRGRLMLSGGDEAMFDDTDGSVTSAEVVGLNGLAIVLLLGLDNAGDTAKLVLWNATTQTANDIILGKGRTTPAVVRSRRIKQFLIG